MFPRSRINRLVALAALTGPWLTSNPSDSEVQTSADGRWIVFIRSVEVGGTSAQHVFIASANGRGVTEVTTGPVSDRSPSFSRSGRRIFPSRFVKDSAEEKIPAVEHIFSVRRGGGRLRRLTSGHFSDRDPVVSPNGRIIAFDRAGVGGGRHVYTMRRTGLGSPTPRPTLPLGPHSPTSAPPGIGSSSCAAVPTRPTPTSSRCDRTGRSGVV